VEELAVVVEINRLEMADSTVREREAEAKAPLAEPARKELSSSSITENSFTL
jgi:hypothetical protein